MSARLVLAALGLLVAASCSGKSGGPDPVEPDRPAPAGNLEARMLARLKVAAECGAGAREHAHWCTVAEGWATGTAAELPDGDHVWVGLSLALVEEGDDESNLADNVLFAAFAARNKGGGDIRAVITDVDPSGAEEREMVAAARDAIAAVLRGQGNVARIAKPLVDHIATFPPDAPHKLTRGEKEWILEGAARAKLRRVGDAWVALEQPTEGPAGLFVSVFVEVGVAE